MSKKRIAEEQKGVSQKLALVIPHALTPHWQIISYGCVDEYHARSFLHFLYLPSSSPLGSTVNLKYLLGKQAKWST